MLVDGSIGAFSHQDGKRRKRDDWMAYVDRVLKNPLWRRRIIETGKPTPLVQCPS